MVVPANLTICNYKPKTTSTFERKIFRKLKLFSTLNTRSTMMFFTPIGIIPITGYTFVNIIFTLLWFLIGTSLTAIVLAIILQELFGTPRVQRQRKAWRSLE